MQYFILFIKLLLSFHVYDSMATLSSDCVIYNVIGCKYDIK